MAKKTKKFTFVYPPTLPYGKLYQRPQQLCRALAELGHTVYFCDHPQTHDEDPVTMIIKDGIHIIQSGWLRVISGLGPHVFMPSWAKYNSNNYAKPANRVATVYDCLDNFPEWDAMEKQMFIDADIILCSSDANLERAKRNSNAPCVVAYNAVDPKQFPVVKAEPSALNKVPKGIRAVFSGCVGRWVDINLIKYSAAVRPDIQYVFLGEVWDDAARAFFRNPPKNVHLLGHVSHAELAGILQHCSVGIVPFITNNQVTDAADPIKIWEYLAVGLPVVSTDIREVHKFGSLVRIKNELPYFAAAISQEANGDTPEKRTARRQFIKSNTWVSRAKDIVKSVDKFLR